MKSPFIPLVLLFLMVAALPASAQSIYQYRAQQPRWISPDGKSFWLVWTDFQEIDKKRPYYAFNLQKVEVTLA